MFPRRFPVLIASIHLLLAGCYHSGLSDREAGSQTFSTYLMSMYEDPNFVSGPAPTPKAPCRLAVAQVGEIAPPQEMLEHFRKQKQMFTSADGVPGMLMETYVPNETPDMVKDRVRREIHRMQRFAQSLGADYLFIYGGTVDHAIRDNPLSVLDLTIVGMFIFPSKTLTGVAKASGALIEVGSGRVVMLSTAESQKSGISTTARQDSNSEKLVSHMRESVTERLGERFVEQYRQRVGLPPLSASRNW